MSIFILFSKTKRSAKSNTSFLDHTIRQYHTVEYLGCHLYSDLSGKSMAVKVNVKFNVKLIVKSMLNFFIDKTNI